MLMNSGPNVDNSILFCLLDYYDNIYLSRKRYENLDANNLPLSFTSTLSAVSPCFEYIFLPTKLPIWEFQWGYHSSFLFSHLGMYSNQVSDYRHFFSDNLIFLHNCYPLLLRSVFTIRAASLTYESVGKTKTTIQLEYGTLQCLLHDINVVYQIIS